MERPIVLEAWDETITPKSDFWGAFLSQNVASIVMTGILWAATSFTLGFWSWEIYKASIDPGTTEVDPDEDTSDLVD